jgi:hypothetical protein
MHKNSVTVVLATHKDSEQLRLSIASVLAQQDVELELIVIGDGAPTGVLERIEQLADSRIRYIPTSRAGLTNALIIGCDAAKYPLIARLDVGDFMVANRLCKQASILSTNKDIGLVSSNFSMYTDEGYYLFKTDYTTESLRLALRSGGESEFSSPMHASVMFSKKVYSKVGGYRAEFYFTQDCDLWTRMLELSDIVNVDEVLSGGIFSTSGISARYQSLQAQYRRMAIQLRDRRGQELETQSILDNANTLSKQLADQSTARLPTDKPGTGDAIAQSNGFYFVARCLMSQDSAHANVYWRRLLKSKRWHLQGWFFYLLNNLRPTVKSDCDIDFSTLEFH